MPTPVDQQIALAKTQMQKEMPDVAGTSIQPMGWLSHALAPSGAQAITNPLTGSVYYNPAAMEGQSQNEVTNTLAHELTHSRQAQSQPWSSRILGGLKEAFSPSVPYEQRPYEMEAFQTERNRDLANHVGNYGDIQLPSPIQGLKKAR